MSLPEAVSFIVKRGVEESEARRQLVNAIGDREVGILYADRIAPLPSHPEYVLDAGPATKGEAFPLAAATIDWALGTIDSEGYSGVIRRPVKILKRRVLAIWGGEGDSHQEGADSAGNWGNPPGRKPERPTCKQAIKDLGIESSVFSQWQAELGTNAKVAERVKEILFARGHVFGVENIRKVLVDGGFIARQKTKGRPRNRQNLNKNVTTG